MNIMDLMNVHGEIKSVGVDFLSLSLNPPPLPLSTSVYRAQDYVKCVICSIFRCAANSDAGHGRRWRDRQAAEKCIALNLVEMYVSRCDMISIRANWSKRKLSTRYYIN